MNRSLSNWRRMVTEFFLREIKLELSWFAVSWGRMANEFFLREINAHRCMMFNLSLGSASAMRRLRQELPDVRAERALRGSALRDRQSSLRHRWGCWMFITTRFVVSEQRFSSFPRLASCAGP